MVRHLRQTGILLLAAVGLIAVPSEVWASWLGYKNATDAPVVVQMSVVVNGQVRHGKPNLLYSGEVAWDSIPGPGTRIVSVYDPKQPKTPIYSDTVTIANQDILLSVQKVAAQPAQKGQPAQPAKTILTPSKLETPPGIPVQRR